MEQLAARFELSVQSTDCTSLKQLLDDQINDDPNIFQIDDANAFNSLKKCITLRTTRRI